MRRTKPYGYHLFNLDGMAMVCEILSTPAENLWTFTTPDGRGIRKACEFMVPFIADKKKWTRKPDVMYFDEWPVRHPALLFGGLALKEPSLHRAMEEAESRSDRGRSDPQFLHQTAGAVGVKAGAEERVSRRG